ncbi:MAG: putative lipid II flippase FtsW [Firmicutes bacterium HGW-Firmicutes-15]|nr:MAG: putative lipid II flippase FtsW [Firmicutes bacterium HGW-Firmicutes-15]
MRLKKGPPDFILFITSITLMGIGLVMVFSSSAVTANVNYGDAYYFFKKQLMWAIISIVALIVVMKLNFLRLKDFAIPLMVIAVVCLILVIPLGIEVKGAVRSFAVGPVRFSPSELSKIAMVMFLARSLDIKSDNISSFTKGVLPFLVMLVLICGLIMLQPDLGTSFTIAATVFFMLMIAGAQWIHLGLITLSGVVAVGAAIILEPYRMERVVAFMNPWKYASDEGFQTIQSLYALGSGGLFGMGLGRSRQKFFYLPEQHTDFIFAILGEELGFIGAFLVVTLFLLFAWRGFKIAINAPDNFSRLLAAGVTIIITFQAAINIGVVAGALPVTGITLPFISYGGTSLLFTMVGVGLLLNISRYSSQS